MRIVDLHGRTKANLMPDGAKAACEQLWRHDFPQYSAGAEVFWEQDENGGPCMRYRFTVSGKGLGRQTVERICDYQLAPPNNRTFTFRDHIYRLDDHYPGQLGVALLISRYNALTEEVEHAQGDDKTKYAYLSGQRDAVGEAVIELLRINHL